MKVFSGIYLVLGLTLSCSLVACGGDADGGDDGIDSGVSPDKPINDVSVDEAEKICKAVDDYVRDSGVGDSVCKLQGISAGALALITGEDVEDACSEAYDECQDDDEPLLECDGDAAPEDCDSSVGEVEACFQALIDEQSARIEMLDLPDCADLQEWATDPDRDMSELGDVEVDPKDVDECRALEASCFD